MMKKKYLNCVVCGKPLTKIQVYNRQKCCSPQCSGRNPLRSKKMRETSCQRYGVDHIMKSEKFVQKIKDTWKDKEKDEVDDMNSLVEQTNLKKYGCRRPLQNKTIQQKLAETNVKKYGSASTFQVSSIREKSKKTLKERYDVENPMKNEEIKNKSLVSKRLFYFKKLKDYVKDYVVPLFNEEDYTNNSVVYKWKCIKCGNEFEQHLHKTQINGYGCYIPRCLNCFPYIQGFSYGEKELVEFIQSIYDGEILENNRKIIKPKEVDIYIPEKRVAIEYNGMYWHSIELTGQEDYHLDKVKGCFEKDVHLVHIFDFQWKSKKEIIKNKIKALLGIYTERIFARKCIVKELSTKEKDKFLEGNHIQGKDRSAIKLGLFYRDELKAVMTFGRPRFNKNYEYELIRYATNCHVIGGAGKLLRFFEKNYNPKSLITYADRCWSNGAMYRKIGFTELEPSKPSYFYLKDNLFVSRFQAQKQKLKKLLGDRFDPELTESENMAKNKFYKIFDCGNLVFIKLYS